MTGFREPPLSERQDAAAKAKKAALEKFRAKQRAAEAARAQQQAEQKADKAPRHAARKTRKK
jgi:hypothetical protein